MEEEEDMVEEVEAEPEGVEGVQLAWERKEERQAFRQEGLVVEPVIPQHAYPEI